MKKNYLLLILLIAVFGCEKEENISNSSYLEESFHSADFKATIPYEYSVDWKSGEETFSDNFETNILEFPIIYTSTFNPTSIGSKKSPAFTIIAIKNKDSYKFYVQKYLNLNYDTFQVLLNFKKEFTGSAKTIDQNANVLFSDLYIEGKLVAGLDKEASSTNGSILNQKVMALDRSYYVIYTERWKDWYRGGDGGGGEWVYTHSTYEGRTEEVVWSDNDAAFYDYYSSQGNITGGGGSGPYGDGYAGTATFEETTIEKIDERNASFEILKDPSFENTKAECVYDKLNQLSSTFKFSIKNFDSEFSVTNIVFTVDNEIDTANAVTNNSENDRIIIKINGNTLESRTVLGLARTLAHEVIHAELYRKVRSVGGQV